ncbi:MAG TPA: hypothetical protein VF421_09015 [Niabella sp.]
MKKVTFYAFSVCIIGCLSNGGSLDKASDPVANTDPTPFGNVQSLLERHASGEKIIRIDSLVAYETGNLPALSIYFVTAKGPHVYTRKGRFDTLLLKGYKANGAHDCILKTFTKAKSISKCRDTACTLVIDTTYVVHKVGPYPVLHPGDDTLSAPYPPYL